MTDHPPSRDVALAAGVLLDNHRYRFTTWRWGRIVAALLLMGAVMKLMLPTSVDCVERSCRTTGAANARLA